MPPLRVAFLGAGGVGGWLAARLAQARAAEVVVIARGRHGDVIRREGLRLTVRSGGSAGSAQESLCIPPEDVEVHSSVAEALERGAKPVDFMVLAVKSWQVLAAAAEAQPLLAPDGCVVTTQNGVEAPHEAATAVGPERTLAGVCKVLAYIAEPGHIEMQVAPAMFHFGECFVKDVATAGSSESARVQRLAEVFGNCSGVTSGVASPSVWAAIWEKAIIMCSIGPVGALCRAPIDKITSIPETRSLLKAAMLEVAQCGAAAGHLPEGDTSPATRVDMTLAMVEKASPGSTPSTLRDVVTGRPSELNELTGGIRRAGQSLGVPTPTHNMIFAALVPQERRARGEEPYELVGVPGGAPHVAAL